MKALISFVLLCAVLVGGYMTFIKKDTTYDASQNAPAVENANEVKGVEETVAPTEPFTIKGTFFDLAKKSGSYKCTVSHEVSVAESVGTVYVSGSKIRGEFTSTIPQVKMKVNSTMISDGTSLWYIANELYGQSAAYTQTYSTALRTVNNPTTTAVATTAATQTTPWGFDSQAQADSLPVQINACQADILELKKNVTALIDDLQAVRIAQ